MSGGSIHFGVWKYEETEFDITRDDLSYKKGTVPVITSKRDPKDTFNRVIIKWTDRTKTSGYNLAKAEDTVDQRISGIIRARTFNLLGITNAELATKMAYRILAESMYRYSTYAFTLSYRSMTVEAGDVGTLTDGFGIEEQRIRITRITEDKDGKRLNIEAVEDKQFLYLQPDLSYSENVHERTVVPELVEPNVYFTESPTEPIVHFHICPQDEYCNGFAIYYSVDGGDSYIFADSCLVDVQACNIDGTMHTDIPAHPAVIYKPLETFVLAQNATFINIQPANDLQFFNNLSLIKVEDEIIAFKEVEVNNDSYMDWDVTTLIRGLFNTEAIAHAGSGEGGVPWHTLNVDFKFTHTVEDIGTTIYFKVLTFYGRELIQLEDATPIQYTIKGSYRKPAPVSLTRIDGREGLEIYKTDEFDVKVNLSSKISGWNIGGLSVEVFGAFTRDSDINSVELKVRELDDTLIYSEAEAVDGSSISDYTKTITLAMRDGNDPVKISITPAAFVPADERKIEADDIRS